MSPGKYHKAGLHCLQGDITQRSVDAIVNAANTELKGGSGVDGAIHAAAGPELLAETRRRYPEGCPTGEARVTAGHNLSSRHVIHTAGPIWRGGDHGEAELLGSCYRESLRLAASMRLSSIAFPAISTGAYGYPAEAAAAVTMRALLEELQEPSSLLRVEVVLFHADMFELYRHALAELMKA